MKVTFHYLIHPSTVVTQQYPENRATLKMPERLRAQLSMVHDENGYHKCTACHICEQACPNASIHVLERPTPAAAKTELDTFIWRLDSCTFCNLCVMVCPFNVLKMNSTFESSVYDQRLLVMNLVKYAGPTSTVLAKMPDDETRKKAIEARDPYSGPTALNGFAMAGIPGYPTPQAIPEVKS
jgi:NADH-quinone oxidoreductase subunit I